MKSVIRFLLTLIPMIVLYGFVATIIWLGLHYGNGWVIAAGIIYMFACKCNISTNTDNERNEK